MNEPYLLRSIRKGKGKRQKEAKNQERRKEEKEGRKGKPKGHFNMTGLTAGRDSLFRIDMTVILVSPPPLARGVGSRDRVGQ